MAQTATTTLAAEAQFFLDQARIRADNYQEVPLAGCPLTWRVVKIIQSLAARVQFSEADVQGLTAVVSSCITRQEPILISLAFAVGMRIPNPLKFRDRTNLPHLGWMHFFWFFKVLHERVSLVYPPGIRVVMFDETTLFGHFFGVDLVSSQRCIAASRRLIDALGTPVEIMSMIKEDFPVAEVDRMITLHISDERIYSMVGILPAMNNPEFLRLYHQSRDRDYTRLRQVAGPLWVEAFDIAAQVDRCMAYRKQANLFSRWLGTDRYIDASLTEKPNRVCFKPSVGLINHGMPIVTIDAKGKYKMSIVPEYRVTEETPVTIDVQELAPEEPERQMVFYYHRV